MTGRTGDWEKLRNLGSGSFGIVSLWKNSRSNEIIALKKCRNEDDLDRKTRDFWHGEVARMKKLNHENIIKILELPSAFAKLTKLPILCMEFCSRGDLRKELCRDENICGLPEESVRAILWDVKSGVEYLHSNKITHRDLKPENIVMSEIPSPSGTKVVYKLIDFGFAKDLNQGSLCSTIVGTLQYIAPELLHDKPYTWSVDYWSFGLVCHEIITGFRPFLPNMNPCDPKWVENVRNKSNDHICIYETVDGTVEYKKEIFAENHISQPLKYALECWLRIALEWDGSKRGRKQRDDYSIIIFSSLEIALKKKIVTVYCVKRLEKLSYEIDESTLIGTLKQWIERDSGISISSQVLLLPSGDSLEVDNNPILPHLDNDPKLVAMLYVVSIEEGVMLPGMETLRMKHPPLVIRMLESPADHFSYSVVRRMWANSVFFIQSVLESYRALIETYSVKMLSLIEYQKKKLLDLQNLVTITLNKIQCNIEFSKDSLQVDLNSIKHNQVSSVVDSNLGFVWKSSYVELEKDCAGLIGEAEVLLPKIDPILVKINKLQDFEEPGQAHSDELSDLLAKSRKLYGSILRLPQKDRHQIQDSSEMVKVIYDSWEVIGVISNDEPFKWHLEELAKTDKKVTDLIKSLNSLYGKLNKLHVRVKKIHLDRQTYIWTIAKRFGQPNFNLVQRSQSEHNHLHPPPTPLRVALGPEFFIQPERNQ